MYQKQKIQIQKQICTKNRSVVTGTTICINIHETHSDTIHPCFEPLQIQYEDDVFLIVQKPAHMLVHTDGVECMHTLCNLVKGYFLTTNQSCPIRPIHRLDKETTGLVLFCKIPFFQPMLDQMLQNKEIYREYDAIVVGACQCKNKCIQASIGRDRHHAGKMRISAQGKSAKTWISSRFVSKSLSLLHCVLESGRTHQIRVHLASIQHAILADALYGKPHPKMQRLALHASSLTFYHPILQQRIQVQCPLPQDMLSILRFAGYRQ